MLKKLLMSGLLGVTIAAGLVGEAKGHLKGYADVGGSWVHISSFTSSIDITGVPNPDTKPSLFRATASVKRVEVLCVNPNNQSVNPGESATQTVVIVQDTIKPDDIIDKKKGIAHKEALFPDDPFLNPEFCVNPNWTPIDALVTELEGIIDIFECAGPVENPCSQLGVKTYTERKNCVLPSEFDIENPPPPGTHYTCVFTLQQHLK